MKLISKPYLLYVTELFPYPPDSGGRIKTLHSIQTLSKEFRVIVYCYSQKSIPRSHLKAVKNFCFRLYIRSNKNISSPAEQDLWKLAKNYLIGLPYFFSQFYSKSTHEDIEKIINKYPISTIHIDHLVMAQYLPKEKKHIWIYEEHNIEHELALKRFNFYPILNKTRIFFLIEYVYINIIEKRLLKKFDYIFAISDHDAKIIKKITPNTPCFIYSPVMELMKREKAFPSTKRENKILFIGDINWLPNTLAMNWFVHKVFPKILKNNSFSSLTIIGRISSKVKVSLEKQIGVHCTGYKENIETEFRNHSVFVLPFFVGGGVRIKALTAFANHILVVSTPQGMQGLKVFPNKEYLSANSEDSFANQCLMAIKDKNIANKITNSASRYLNKHHSKKNDEDFLTKYLSITQ